jgi:hypothetical protein
MDQSPGGSAETQTTGSIPIVSDPGGLRWNQRMYIYFIFIYLFIYVYSYVHTMFGSFPPSPHPLPYHPLCPLPLPPTPSIPSRNYSALISNFVVEKV